MTSDDQPRSAAGSTDAAGLAHDFSELARALEREHDLQGTLDAIVRGAVDTVPGAEHASISTVRGRREVITRASTDDLVRGVDRAQYTTGQGPCLDTLYERRTVHLADISAEEQWPDFIARAAALGVGSMLAVQLYVDGEDLGALNLVNGAPGAFDHDSESIALLFATHAAVAMVGAQARAQLQTAMDTRDMIGQAMGILMERYKIPADRAFALLARASQHRNRKLHDVADELVTHGDLAGLS